ncbi:DUF6090 family protein [Lutimonas zeaxanthinifaciens]|uniref:DUF6090 family protein n=1 Tax=Lutimonas zeaxanthinifaciens TaxID=3060215 RepID=UPI00265CD070|nr:DUF6090 family protein [Lutimonas sp. YSD2104]WKK66505.1 DUF6090 family protein [Lutimonas sp. YSD2104]
MLPFFRKIRWRLAQDNQFFKYSRYAIGEIVLVVIGILIALQINTWKEEKEKDAKVKVYLENLRQNLNSDVLVLKDLKAVNVFKFYAFQYLLDQSGHPIFDYKGDELRMFPFETNSIWKKPYPSKYDPEFIRLAFLWSHRLVNQDLNHAALDEFKSTGMYSYLEKNELKSAINSYYTIADQRIGETKENKNEEIRELWETSLGKEGLLTSSIMTLNEPLDLIRGNLNRMYLVQRMARESLWIAASADVLIAQAQNLILMIDEEVLSN